MSLQLHVLAPVVGDYKARLPHVELELSSNEGFVDILERRIDFAIRFGQLKDSTLHTRLLGHSRLRTMASPGYLKRRGTPEDPSELKSRELLGFSEPEALNYWPLQNRDGTSVHIRPTFSATSGGLRVLAANDQGLTCLSEFSTDVDLKSYRLVEDLAAKNTGASQSVHAVFRQNTALSARI